jgi:hypothetical protein
MLPELSVSPGRREGRVEERAIPVEAAVHAARIGETGEEKSFDASYASAVGTRGALNSSSHFGSIRVAADCASGRCLRQGRRRWIRVFA